MLADVSYWALLTPSESAASEVWRICCRVQAVLYLTHILFSQWPYRLAGLLGPTSDEEIVSLLSAPPCTLDGLSAHLREKWGTAEAMQSQRFKAIVAAYVHVVEGSTFSTERVHSKNSRRTHMRRWTHAQDISGIALFHQAVSAPRWSQCFMDAASLRKNTKDKSDEDATAERAVTVPVKRRGAGGAWRAMVHLKRSQPDDTGNLPSLRQIAEDYKNLTEPERVHLKEIGAKATKLRRVTSGAIFPKTAAAAASASAAAVAREAALKERATDHARIMRQELRTMHSLRTVKNQGNMSFWKQFATLVIWGFSLMISCLITNLVTWGEDGGLQLRHPQNAGTWIPRKELNNT